jgi:polysaccharide pyruvyl transferase WcaK-like protein
LLRKAHLNGTGAPSLYRIGVSVRRYGFGFGSDSVRKRTEFEVNLADALKWLADARPNVEIVFVPQSHDGDPNDAQYAKQLVDTYDLRARVIDERLPFDELMGFYGSCAFVIGVRLHACISALTQRTPVVAIGYEPKTVGAMQDLHLSSLCLDIRSADTAALIRAFEVCMELTDAQREALWTRVVELGNLAASSLEVTE